MDLTATGMAFPIEQELLEYSESEDEYANSFDDRDDENED
jgi:hypothetical protein